MFFLKFEVARIRLMRGRKEYNQDLLIKYKLKASGLEPEPCSLKGRHSSNRVLLPTRVPANCVHQIGPALPRGIITASYLIIKYIILFNN
jgi:hypothetical protein